MRISLLAAAFGIVLLAGGCTAHVGVEGVTLPPDAARICQQQCSTIGLGLGAVAIMANNVGCVCQATPAATPDATPDAPGGPGATAAGMATIMLQQQQKRQQQQQQQQQLQQQ